jgi:hypothetical protein
VLFVIGAAATAWAIAPTVPHDQEIRIVFRTLAPRPVRRVTLTWEVPGGEPLGGVTLHPSGASRELSHTLRLPNGEYVLNIDVERAQGPTGATAIETHRSRVELQGEPTTLYLSDRK